MSRSRKAASGRPFSLRTAHGGCCGCDLFRRLRARAGPTNRGRSLRDRMPRQSSCRNPRSPFPTAPIARDCPIASRRIALASPSFRFASGAPWSRKVPGGLCTHRVGSASRSRDTLRRPDLLPIPTERAGNRPGNRSGYEANKKGRLAAAFSRFRAHYAQLSSRQRRSQIARAIMPAPAAAPIQMLGPDSGPSIVFMSIALTSTCGPST